MFTLVAHYNMREPALRALAADAPLVRFLEQRQWVIQLDEYADTPELYGDLVLPDWLREGLRAWLVVPLLHGEQLEGFLVLAEARARQQLNWEDRDLLKTAGRQAASHVALLETAEALWEARQFEAFHRLSAYVVHDLKNIAAQLALVVANASRHRHNPAFVDDAFETVANATERMNRLLGQLRKGSLPGAGLARPVAVADAVRQAVTARAGQAPAPGLCIEAEPWVAVERERLVAVLEHLLQNAQEATRADGLVAVTISQADTMAVVAVRDTGCGMDERFVRERLFRPFTTTKGNAGMGIGVYESREFARAAGGELTVQSQPDQGTTFWLRLPCCPRPAAIGGEETDEWTDSSGNC